MVSQQEPLRVSLWERLSWIRGPALSREIWVWFKISGIGYPWITISRATRTPGVPYPLAETANWISLDTSEIPPI